jgi:hypothetical protein
MALRSEYSLAHSEFNEFLFAFVGEEKSGIQLTVLSALARLGFDPWAEAARLSGLSKEAATSALSIAIAKLPEGDWKASESQSIALRLVNCLPRRGSSSQTPARDGRGEEQKPKLSVPSWLVWAVIAVALFILTFWQQAD